MNIVRILGNSRKTRPVAVTTENRSKMKSSNVALGKEKVQPHTAGKRQGDVLQDTSQKRRAAFGDITNVPEDAFKDKLKNFKAKYLYCPKNISGSLRVTSNFNTHLKALADKANIKVALKKSKLPAVAQVKHVVPQQKPANKNQKQTKEKKKVKPSVPKTQSPESLEDESMLSLISSSQESNGGSSSSSQESLAAPSEISYKGIQDLVPLEEDTPDNQIDDVDKENLHDPVQVALYVSDIFRYYKERELQFKVEPYMVGQKFITCSMRAILVDRLVKVQGNFELNHETLYLAVKLVDMYVSRVVTPKESLQLVGAVALFVAAKFDECCPPLVEKFLYIFDNAYKRKEFLDMERCILHAIGFDIGMPLSCRFLRRYAKCGRANMETLTLARYILEMSLMEYDFIHRRESEMAAASFWLALRMKKAGEWTKTLVHHTGYEETELTGIAKKLNNYISNPPKQLTTIRSKYSHKVFYEVAKIPTLSDSDFV